ncbi:DNA replication licensing factor mcm8 [Podila epicladia]|nr:DNA replication licensing factor mcm8 [Podila epicladia]
MESGTTTPQYARRGGRGGGRGRGWRGGSKNKYYPGGAQNPQDNYSRKRWQPETSDLNNGQDQLEYGVDGFQPGAVVVDESDIPAQALQAQPPQKRQLSVDCPYRGWDQYLPQHDYHIGHEFNVWIKEFQQYFLRALLTHGLNTMEEIRTKHVAIVNFHALVQGCLLPDLELLLRTRPMDVLGCMALAVISIVDSNTSPAEERVDDIVVRIAQFDAVVTRSKDLKAHLIGNLVTVNGTVVRTSGVNPLCTKMAFTCNSCQEVQTLDFPDSKFIQPTSCTRAGCRGKQFTPQRGIDYDTTTVDWQTIRLQEKLPDDKIDAGRIPRTIDCEVTQDLVDKVIPGDVVGITGIVKVTQAEKTNYRNKSENTMYLLYLDVNYITKSPLGMEDDYADEQEEDTKKQDRDAPFKDSIHLSEKDMYAIQELVAEPQLFKLIVNSFSPAIFGHEMVKVGILFALFGGRRKNPRHPAAADRSTIRSDPHVLVVGDPGLGKSQMLMAAVKLAPRGVYVCGSSGISTSGLTVTLVRGRGSEFALEAGALVLADQGCCCIDELDKMTTDHNALLEAMEQQSISVAKAGIICSLPARTSVIAAANPVGGHYNLAKTVSENLKMNSALLSRFDLIFILMDKPDDSMDKYLSMKVMAMHSGNPANFDDMGAQSQQRSPQGNETETRRSKRRREDFGDDDDEMEDVGAERRAERERIKQERALPLPERLKMRDDDDLELVPQSLLRKYIAYARKYVMPRLSQEASDILQEFYLMLRVNHRSPDGTPVTTRQLESMLRMAEARARMELREVVTRHDARDVVEVITFSLQDAFNSTGTPGQGTVPTRGGKSALVKRYVSELHRKATSNSSNIFTRDQLYQTFRDLRMAEQGFEGGFDHLLDRLNNQNYLLMKGSGRYQLATQ